MAQKRIAAGPVAGEDLDDTPLLNDLREALGFGHGRRFGGRVEVDEDRSGAGITALTRGSRIGDFEIVDLVGRGGMGLVYRANQVSTRKVMALKVLSRPSSSALVERFRVEIDAVSRLHHPNVIRVLASGEASGYVYYAMPLVERDCACGIRVLSTRWDVTRGSKADEECHNGAFEVFAGKIAEVADGLAHAHDHGVIHRDIKPQNLLMDSGGRLLITDFGLALLEDEPRLTSISEVTFIRWAPPFTS